MAYLNRKIIFSSLFFIILSIICKRIAEIMFIIRKKLILLAKSK